MNINYDYSLFLLYLLFFDSEVFHFLISQYANYYPFFSDFDVVTGYDL